MIGQLTTSFLQGKVSPTMTSTTYSQCAEHVTEESKTACSNESLGATQNTPSNKGWVSLVRGANDLMPYSMRPIKARRRRIRPRYGWGAELYAFKLVWHSHHKPRIKAVVGRIVGSK
jgi:hypothetical protein